MVVEKSWLAPKGNRWLSEFSSIFFLLLLDSTTRDCFFGEIIFRLFDRKKNRQRAGEIRSLRVSSRESRKEETEGHFKEKVEEDEKGHRRKWKR